ncbi:hypothetical protein F5J12DRAFT_781742 [Pisolithus orientalis]|uniref:uncharacterized protein n=1 Tax=Pisolithus orientalis TaxID=936130 RepID=UPI0022259EE5|nr:uncharacterized protein F5J12DRAFT_781742 [Pisolithus orientalis]KAI6010741.1 hypothetical protein F5J12DRAFT_781742 [Pisolithus orientalis]
MSGYSCHTSEEQKKLSKSEVYGHECPVAALENPLPEAEDEELEWKCTNVLDSLKFTASESESEDELEHDDATFQVMGVGEADLCAQLVNLAISAGDDPLGETWLPLREAKCAA